MDQWQTCVWLPGVETEIEWSEMEFRIVKTTCVVVTIFCDTQNDVLDSWKKSEQSALLHESIGRIRSIDC